jgi:predicted transcriptional regulator
MPQNGENTENRVELTLADIQETLMAEVIVGIDKMDTPVTAGTGSDLMSDIIRGPTSGAVLLTGLNNVQVVRTSIISGVAGVVLVRGKRPAEDVTALAREHELPLLSTPFTLFSACGRLFRRGLRGVE